MCVERDFSKFKKCELKLIMSLLIFSQKCSHSKDVIAFIQKHPQLKQIVHYHDVNVHGLPMKYRDRITRVPTMLTKNGKILIGSEIKNWLQSLLPNEHISHHEFGSACNMGGIDGGDVSDDTFALDGYGQALAPPITPELEKKINAPVGQGAVYESVV